MVILDTYAWDIISWLNTMNVSPDIEEGRATYLWEEDRVMKRLLNSSESTFLHKQSHNLLLASRWSGLGCILMFSAIRADSAFSD